MSKATQQSAERCQDKRSSLKPAARRPAAQLQIRVYGLSAHFAGSGRDGPRHLYYVGWCTPGGRHPIGAHFSSSKKICTTREKISAVRKTPRDHPGMERISYPNRPFCQPQAFGLPLSVGPIKSGAATPTPPAIQNFFTEERRNMRPFAVSSRTILP